MTFVRENAIALVAAVAMIAIAVVLALVVASSMRPAGSATVSPSPSPVAVRSDAPSPSAPPPSAPPSPSPSTAPTAGPSPKKSSEPLPTGAIDIPRPIPAVTIDGADPDVVAAIEASIQAIGDLETYHGEMETYGRDLANISHDSRLDLGLRADVVTVPINAYDAQFGLRMVEADDSAAISTGGRLVRIGDEAWGVDEAGGAEPMPVDNSTVQFIAALLPDGAAARMIAPFAGGYERVGDGARQGVVVDHYRLTEAGAAAYAEVTGVDGTWTGDVWIAVDGGYLVEAKVTATTPTDDTVRDVSFVTSVQNANDPDIEITPPA